MENKQKTALIIGSILVLTLGVYFVAKAKKPDGKKLTPPQKRDVECNDGTKDVFDGKNIPCKNNGGVKKDLNLGTGGTKVNPKGGPKGSPKGGGGGGTSGPKGTGGGGTKGNPKGNPKGTKDTKEDSYSDVFEDETYTESYSYDDVYTESYDDVYTESYDDVYGGGGGSNYEIGMNPYYDEIDYLSDWQSQQVYSEFEEY